MSYASLEPTPATRGPIAGVHPASVREATVAVVWPSIAAGPWGRWFGKLYENRLGFRLFGAPITLGWVFVIATSPFAAYLYLSRRSPRWPMLVAWKSNPDCLRYRVTNKRLLIENPFLPDEPAVAELPLEGFDEIAIEHQDGDVWYLTGDLVFNMQGQEKLRMNAVARPKPFRQLCLETRLAYQQ